jgi:hypothetical protein
LEFKDPSGPRPIRHAIQQLFRESGLRRPAASERLFDAWSAAAGSPWAERSTPVAFQRGRMTIEVDSSVHLQELRNFHGEAIRARANQALGGDVIRKVVFKLRG